MSPQPERRRQPPPIPEDDGWGRIPKIDQSEIRNDSIRKSLETGLGGGGGNGGGGPVLWALIQFAGLVLAVVAAGGLVWSLFAAFGLALLRIIVGLGLFVLFSLYVLTLLAAVPGRPGWRRHAEIARLIRPAPFLVPVVIVFTNYFPTELVESYYTERTFGAYLMAIVAMAYQVAFKAFAPHEPEICTPAEGRSRPAARYALAVLAFVFLGGTALLTASLFPASIRERPEQWWLAFWPF